MKLLVKNPLPKIKTIWIAVPVAIVSLGAIAYAVNRWASGRDRLPPGTAAPASFKDVPFARGVNDPLWPLLTNHDKNGLVSYRTIGGENVGNYSRRFGAQRDDRYHVGIDLYANYGDPVVAMADGVVTRTQDFHLGTDAIFVDHGPVVVLYGEVESGSWKDYGISKGSRVHRGQQIARVGCMSWEDDRCKSHMLHLESYVPGTTENRRWYQGEAVPKAILDPTRMLLQAAVTARS